MSKVQLVIRRARVVCPNGILEGGVAVDNGVIVAVGLDAGLPPGEQEIDAAGKVLLPGLIDTHVHFREPGYTAREDFLTGSQAAAAGGVTTVLIMPICVPPTSSVQLLEERLALARAKMIVDFGFYGAANADHLTEIGPLAEAGAIGFKTFMLHPPPERREEFEGLFVRDDAELLAVFREIAKTERRSCIHAENDALISAETRRLRDQGRRGLSAHVASHPPIAELEAASRVLLLAREAGVRLGLCHVSWPKAVRLAHETKTQGQNVTVETCPHYLLLSSDEVEALGPYAKINPPIRPDETRAELWDCLEADMIDYIGSDHAPYTLAEKQLGEKDIWAAPAGIPSVELTLPLLAYEVRAGRMEWTDLARWCSEGAARAFDLYPRKGVIQVGADADLVLLDPQQQGTVKRGHMLTKSRDVARLYEGRPTGGRPVLTLVRGRPVMENGRVLREPGWGRFVSPDWMGPQAMTNA